MNQDFVRLEAKAVGVLLKRMPAKTAVLLYLHCKDRAEGATASELLLAVGGALKTLDNALRTLQHSGEIVLRGGRYYLTGELHG